VNSSVGSLSQNEGKTARPLNDNMKTPRVLLLLFFMLGSTSSCVLHGVSAANEASLESNLKNIRNAIGKYRNEKGVPPQLLDDLVEAGYLRMIPRDPITDKDDWTIVPIECSSDPNCVIGIKDVRSSSTSKSRKGTRYSDW